MGSIHKASHRSDGVPAAAPGPAAAEPHRSKLYLDCRVRLRHAQTRRPRPRVTGKRPYLRCLGGVLVEGGHTRADGRTWPTGVLGQSPGRRNRKPCTRARARVVSGGIPYSYYYAHRDVWSFSHRRGASDACALYRRGLGRIVARRRAWPRRRALRRVGSSQYAQFGAQEHVHVGAQEHVQFSAQYV
jgi:hypothetical protein